MSDLDDLEDCLMADDHDEEERARREWEDRQQRRQAKRGAETAAELERVREINAELVEALNEADDALIATFGQVDDPDNRIGWSDDDAFKTHRKIREALAKHARAETSGDDHGD